MIIGRDREWEALGRFVERRQRLAFVYGPRRVGKSFLLEALAEAAGGVRYQAITGAPAAQLADFGQALGEWLDAGALQLVDWADALQRLKNLDRTFVAIDELPYLLETSPELPGLLQRYVDDGEGPPLILSGSALSIMSDLAEPRGPLFGRAAAIVIPAWFEGAELAVLWGVEDDPISALWIDAALGGLPGYRPLVQPPGSDRDAWMIEEILSPSSPLLDAAEAGLASLPDPSPLRGVYRSILSAIARGETTFAAIARIAGIPSGALTRPLAALRDAGLVTRIPDPLRERRDRYELADPHLRFWLAIVEPSRSLLRAGRAVEVWNEVGNTTWPSQVLGPRWEAVARDFIARGGADRDHPTAGAVVGTTMVPDRSQRRSHQVDIVVARDGHVLALGEAKLRPLGAEDLERLRRIRRLLNAPEAKLILASADRVDLTAEEAEEDRGHLIAITPADVYDGS